MKALKLTDNGGDTIAFQEIEKPVPGKDEVLIKLKAASLNHRDQWCREGKYPGLKTGTTLGSDGSGIVVEIGESVDEKWLEKSVVINPNNQWGDNPDAQSSDYHILGMPTDGTFAEYVRVKSDRLHLKPDHLSFEQTAALPIGGMTAYRALFRQAKVKAGDRVLVTGIGGGVSQFAALFLKALGITYYVTSGADAKIDEAVKNGAAGGFNYRSENWSGDALKSGGAFDAIIDSAGGDIVNTYLKLIRPGGKIVFYGSTAGTPKSLDLFRLFWSQATLQGSTMANDEEFEEMIGFVTKHQVEPAIDSVRPFDEIIAAFDKMKEGKQTGKLVVTFDD